MFMKRNIILGTVFVWVFSASLVFAQEIFEATVKDQTQIELTAYNNGRGFVKDTRRVDLSENKGEIRFEGVASSVIPESVFIQDVSKNGSLDIVGQNYTYDLISPAKLLDEYVGKSIKILEINEFNGKREVVAAVLVSNNDGEVY